MNWVLRSFFKIYLLDKELRKINIYPSRRYFNRLSAKCGNDNHGGEKEAQVQLIKVNPRSGSVPKYIFRLRWPLKSKIIARIYGAENLDF